MPSRAGWFERLAENKNKMTINKKLLLGVVALGLAAVSHVNAQITVAQGDILLGFYQNQGASAGANTYIYNLGKGSDWLSNTNTLVSVVNINADLTLAFGSGWADDATLRMSVIGGFDGSSSSAGLDPTRTIYFSNGITGSFTARSTATPTLISAVRTTTSNNIGANYLANMNAEPLGGATDGGAIVPTSNPNDLAQYSIPTAASYFGATGLNPNASLGGGNLGTGTGGYTVEAAVDLYRILNTATGATLTAGLSAGNAVVGTGQYIGSFTLSSTGDVRMDAVPEPATYALLGLAGVAFMAVLRRRGAKA